MLIGRCAWHAKYFARRKLTGVRRWWPLLPIRYTDGICAACRDKIAAEHAGRRRFTPERSDAR